MWCASPLPAEEPAPPGSRKSVTVLFCDVVGSTSLGEQLDPESVREVMRRFFGRMGTILEHHGGTVEKYIGDAVMAVFGVPTVHEDDALRAVRAASEMHRALPSLNEDLRAGWSVSLDTRIGINTGEVVVGDVAAGQALVVGDAVNVAARLEQAASPGQVLLGRDTYRLVRGVVGAEPVEPLVLKGKRERVSAYRLLSDLPEGPLLAERGDPPLVDRAAELDALRQAFAAVAEQRSCRLVTVVGSAGVGKSRLVREFAATLEGRATILQGRCLPYGEGITFWPVAEIVKQACDIHDDDPRAVATGKIGTVLSGAPEADLVAERVGSIMGLAVAAVDIQETFWAIRRLLEWIGREGPVVVLFDDIQWAEPTFLDLVEYLAGWIRDAPVLLLCAARPDLEDLRPAWGTGVRGDRLSPTRLTEAESEQLLRGILGGGAGDPRATRRITEAAGGNPLFLEELLRMLEDDGMVRREDEAWTAVDLSHISVPPTIQALVSARLDRLTPDERTVIRCASVIGKVFWWGAVSHMLEARVRRDVGGHLQALVRKDLIRPGRSTFAGQDAFRFHHLLVQEAAYRSTPKGVRAELHERFAGWLTATAGDRRVEFEEVLGYHLERAYLYRAELGAVGEAEHQLAGRAAGHLAAAGRRAQARGDLPAAADLLDRAVSLLPAGDAGRRALLPDLGEALMETGDLTRADGLLAAAIEEAEAAGDRGVAAHAAVVRLLLEESTEPEERSSHALRQLEAVIPVFEELGDDLGLARAWRLLGDVEWTRSRYGAVDVALGRALEHARRAGATWEEAEALGQYTGSGVYGPAPVAEVIERCDQVLASGGRNRSVQARALRALASLRAMQGRYEEGRDLARQAADLLEDLGLALRAAFVSETLAFVERLAGEHAAAERELRAGFDAMTELGERGYRTTSAALLAHAILAQGPERVPEAERWLQIAEEAAEDDLSTQVLLRSARGRVLAARGEPAAAERSAREAVSLAEGTDDLNMRADVLLDLAEVLRTRGNDPDAAAAREEALGLYRRKGNLSSAARTERLLESSKRPAETDGVR